jgi:ribosomal protein S18 acetylase RimI-like enzyme
MERGRSDAPRPTRGAASDELLELVHLLARELVLRDEAPGGKWVEETARELITGGKVGWYLPPATRGGLAFRSEQGSVSFGHVHVAASPNATVPARLLCDALLDGLPSSVRSISVGFTGLTTVQETELTNGLAERPGSRVIRRYAMERVLRSRDGEGLPPAPEAMRLVPVRDVTMESLTQLDQRAFRGTTDELLIGTEPEEYRRSLRAILDGSVGRFLDEASVALYRPEPPLLAGAILTCEKTPQRAVFQDLMVDPDLRGRGHGAYLLHWGLRALWALGYERVRLWVSADNQAARRLYDSVGFSTTQTAVIYRWDRSPSAPQPQSPR